MARNPRKVVITLKVETTRTVRELRKAEVVSIPLGDEWAVFERKPMRGAEKLVQVQVNEVKG